MTRDEAVQDTYKMFRSCGPYDSYSDKELLDVAENGVDVFVALGMLKLKEPKSAEDRFWDRLSATGKNLNAPIWDEVRECLHGFEIVEK